MAKRKVREEEVKNTVAKNYFPEYDCTKILGNVDFCVSIPNLFSVKMYIIASFLIQL